MKQAVKKEIQKAVAKLYPGVEVEFSVDFAPENIDANVASNVAMVLAKKLGKKPMEVAEEIATSLRRITGALSPSPGESYMVEAILPGFLNFKLSAEDLVENMNRIQKEKDKFGQSNAGEGKLAIVEYFQLNVAKPPHVGHLRSAVIGDALKRIMKFIGYKAVSDTHIGDWGTQIGIWISALKQMDKKKWTAVIGDIQSSAQAYIEQSSAIEADPAKREEGKQEFVKLEQGDAENRKIWKGLVETAKKEIEKMSEALELLKFDHHFGESFYEDKMPAILERLKQKDLLHTGDTGEQYVDLEQYGLGRLICIKSDGATTYELRDLATLAFRYDTFPKQEKSELAWNLYVVDNRQAHDFKQVFKTMEMLGYDVAKSKHVSFGFMSLPEGALSTRKGNIVSLESLLEEAKSRAKKIIEQKNPELKKKDEIAEQVGLAAVKYFDLKHNRHSDIVFKWDEVLAFEGNTGPYLQYTHARLKSILRKAKAAPPPRVRLAMT